MHRLPLPSNASHQISGKHRETGQRKDRPRGSDTGSVGRYDRRRRGCRGGARGRRGVRLGRVELRDDELNGILRVRLEVRAVDGSVVTKVAVDVAGVAP